MNENQEKRVEIYIEEIDDEMTSRVVGGNVDCCLALLKTLELLIVDGLAPDGFASFVVSRMTPLCE